LGAYLSAVYQGFAGKIKKLAPSQGIMKIKKDDLTGYEVAELLREHLHGMTLHSPPESIHALDTSEILQRAGE
jgi:hypothetical protein